MGSDYKISKKKTFLVHFYLLIRKNTHGGNESVRQDSKIDIQHCGCRTNNSRCFKLFGSIINKQKTPQNNINPRYQQTYHYIC